MFGDRKARVRGHQTIEDAANRARAYAKLSPYANFNPVDFIIGPIMLRIKQNLRLELYNDDKYIVPAFVRFHGGGTGMTLNVGQSVWKRAQAGFALDRYILCHEIGHILMHSHDELAYSESIPSVVAKFPENERTEPQANLFADLVMIPDIAIEGFSCAEDISEYFNVPFECAKRRYDFVADKKRRESRRPVTGEVCPFCANFTLVQKGTSLKCETCTRDVGCL